jgi:cytochrome c6
MKITKIVCVASLTVISLVACSRTETTDHNVNQNANESAITNTNQAPTVSNAEQAPPPANANRTAPTANANQARKETKTPATEEKKEESKAVSEINVAALYSAQKCAACHGKDGKGNKAISSEIPDFTDAAWQSKHSDAEFISMIKKGKKPMPGYESKLTEAEIKALVAYVRSFAKK